MNSLLFCDFNRAVYLFNLNVRVTWKVIVLHLGNVYTNHLLDMLMQFIGLHSSWSISAYYIRKDHPTQPLIVLTNTWQLSAFYMSVCNLVHFNTYSIWCNTNRHLVLFVVIVTILIYYQLTDIFRWRMYVGLCSVSP